MNRKLTKISLSGQPQSRLKNMPSKNVFSTVLDCEILTLHVLREAVGDCLNRAAHGHVTPL